MQMNFNKKFINNDNDSQNHVKKSCNNREPVKYHGPKIQKLKKREANASLL